MRAMRTFLAVAGISIAAYAAAAAEFPKVGASAPAFRLKSNDMKQVSLSSLKGKWVVLYFYPKDFTGGCTIQAKNFQRDLAKYTKRNATIVGVSVDSAESHKKFCKAEGLNFTLLSDPDAKVSTLYNSVMVYEGETMSARNTFLITPKGKIARVFPSVKVAAHSADVLAALDALQK